MKIDSIDRMISKVMNDHNKCQGSCDQIALACSKLITDYEELSCSVFNSDGLILELSYYDDDYGYRDLVIPVNSFIRIMENKSDPIKAEELHIIAI